MRLTAAIATGVVGRGPERSPYVLAPSASLTLGLALSGAPGEAVALGPVWLGTHQIVSDASVHIVGPTVAITRPYTMVAAFARISGTANLYVAAISTAVFPDSPRLLHTVATGVKVAVGVRDASAGTNAGLMVGSMGIAEISGDVKADVGRAGAAAIVTTATTTDYPKASSPLVAGAYYADVGSPVGLGLRACAFFRDRLTQADLDALGASVDWSAVATARGLAMESGIDVANAYDSGGGVWKVIDMANPGVTDWTVVGGDNTDIVAV